MKNLKDLKARRKEVKKELEKLKVELDDLDDKIAKIEGLSREVKSIKENQKDFNKNIKKRPRPSYKESQDFNVEQEERVRKRQNRKIISSENIQDEEDMMDVDKEIETDDIDKITKEIEQELKENEKEMIESNKRRQSKKEIEDLIEEMFEEEQRDLEFKERSDEEITEEISKLYFKVCEQEKILFKGKREMMEIYYDFGKKFEEKLGILLDEEYQEEKTAISKIIGEIMKEEINYKRKSVVRKSEKARKIYRIILAAGGKGKIKKLKNLNSEDYMKFNFREIEEWVRNR